jgi:hypothetical protein
MFILLRFFFSLFFYPHDSCVHRMKKSAKKVILQWWLCGRGEVEQ